MDTKCTPSSCGRRGLKNMQKPLRVIFFPSLACHDRTQIIDLDRGSGHRSCTCTVNPKNFFFVVVSAVLHSTSFPFSFFFLLYSSVAQTLKNVGPLDCNLRLLRRRSLGDKISVAEVMHLSERFLSKLSCGFSCCFFFSFLFFHSFSLLLSFSFLFLCGDLELFFLVEIVSESTLIATSFARLSISSLPSGHCAMCKRAGVFGAHSVQGHRRWGRPRQGLLGALEKQNLSLRNVSKPKVSYTGQPANLHRANAQIEQNVS